MYQAKSTLLLKSCIYPSRLDGYPFYFFDTDIQIYKYHTHGSSSSNNKKTKS